MFATLLGALPRPPLSDDAPFDALAEAAVRAQEAAGLEPITDGGSHGEGDLLTAWEATQRLTSRAVKQAVTGPYTLGRSATGSAPGPARERSAATLARAATLNVALRELAAAGCPLIEIHEPDAISIGDDPAEQALFRAAHERLTDGLDGRASVARDHRRERRRRRHRDHPRRPLREPGRRSHRRARQLAPGRGRRTGRSRHRVRRDARAGRDRRRPRAPALGGRPMPHRPAAAVSSGSASRPRPRWPPCRGRWRSARWSAWARPRGWPDEPGGTRPAPRPARRQHPQRRPRPRRSAAVARLEAG